MEYKTNCVFYKEKWKEKSTPHHSSQPERECGAEVEDFKNGFCPDPCERFMDKKEVELHKSEV